MFNWFKPSEKVMKERTAASLKEAIELNKDKFVEMTASNARKLVDENVEAKRLAEEKKIDTLFKSCMDAILNGCKDLNKTTSITFHINTIYTYQGLLYDGFHYAPISPNYHERTTVAAVRKRLHALGYKTAIQRIKGENPTIVKERNLLISWK